METIKSQNPRKLKLQVPTDPNLQGLDSYESGFEVLDPTPLELLGLRKGDKIAIVEREDKKSKEGKDNPETVLSRSIYATTIVNVKKARKKHAHLPFETLHPYTELTITVYDKEPGKLKILKAYVFDYLLWVTGGAEGRGLGFFTQEEREDASSTYTRNISIFLYVKDYTKAIKHEPAPSEKESG